MHDDYITDRELKAHLDPIRSDVWEIKADVKTLIQAAAVAQAVNTDSKDRGARRLGWASLAAALVGGMWWIQAAVVHLAH